MLNIATMFSYSNYHIVLFGSMEFNGHTTFALIHNYTTTIITIVVQYARKAAVCY
jgi:hypothetical protein